MIEFFKTIDNKVVAMICLTIIGVTAIIQAGFTGTSPLDNVLFAAVGGISGIAGHASATKTPGA